ncbi:hypothetical protein ACFSHT_34880 [Paraburkholderia silviterrae]|uniref:Phage tail protein n=1 Tax=Paraburkholderia silviterrae TaxID=2528715 RepID=A0A4R5M679_9BURK|nr:hypothetical protein [Paraburkholderia silviterrae]TDG21574.1 hypothetical protein EYW47_22215 [Paraburkholderia silviterrae]
MNLQDQIGALEAGVDQLIQAASAALVPRAVVAAAPEQTHTAEVSAPQAATRHAELAPQTAAVAAAHPHEPQAAVVETEAEAEVEAESEAEAEAVTAEVTTEVVAEVTPEVATASEPVGAAQPAHPVQEAEARNVTLEVGRPSQNEITMSIGGQTVSLHPLQVGQLIEELANARASMQPEPPPAIPPGWRFASTKNPMMAVQKQSNGDRLLVLRHTGHGWVPFVFSPDMVVQMYMMLTQR